MNRRFKQTATICLDSYKLGHADQYAPGTKYVFSNFTPRADRLFSGKKNSNYDGKIVVAGIRAFISEMHYIFKETFFCVPIEKAISEFEEICSSFGSIDKMKTRLIQLHELGKLPLIIRGLPEGSVVNPGVPVLFIANTDENFYWLPNFLETWISSELWKCMTSATTARLYRKTLNKFVIETGSSPEFANWQVHDFSLRGQGGIKDGANSGLGHLMFSNGTDNIPAAKMIHDIYGDNVGSFAGSVPASEHSTSSSNILVNAGKGISLDEAESEFFKRYITEIYPSGICSYVADTYDYWKLITEILPQNKEAILARDGKVVIRPDCYSDDTSIMTDSGWKLFSELSENDLVAQENNGVLEFVKPLKYVNQPYSGEMYRFHDMNGKFDFIVTPNHRMVFDYNGIEKIESAENIKSLYNAHKFKRSAIIRQGVKTLSDIERLKIAFQADGAYVSKQETCIRFSFSKQRKIERLRAILNSGSYKFTEYYLSDGKTEFNVKINASNFQKDFNWVNFSDIDSSWCQDFIEELSHWDSCRRSDSRFKFDSCVFDGVVDIVERIALFAGYGCLISKYEDNRKEHFSDVYTCNIMKNNKIDGQSIKIEKIQYSGNVYCVQVPSGKILVKRNRATAICGNSGDPVRIICGYRISEKNELGTEVIHKDGKYYLIEDQEYKDNLIEIPWYEALGSIRVLAKIFGKSMNEKKYFTVNQKVGIIYGDSITLERCQEILERLAEMKYAADNIVFGVGSYTYQYVTRDTFGFAIKATWVQCEDVSYPIYKDPKTDGGTKKSAKGLLRVVKDENGEYELLQNQEKAGYDETVVYYLEGTMPIIESFSKVKQRAMESV